MDEFNRQARNGSDFRAPTPSRSGSGKTFPIEPILRPIFSSRNGKHAQYTAKPALNGCLSVFRLMSERVIRVCFAASAECPLSRHPDSDRRADIARGPKSTMRRYGSPGSKCRKPPSDEPLTYQLHKFKPLAPEHHVRSVSSEPGEVSRVGFAPVLQRAIAFTLVIGKSLIDFVEPPLG